MGRYQTYQYEGPIWVLGELPSGETVTITLYDLADDSSVTLSDNSCSEVGTTGVYKWSTANITTQPTTMKQYLYFMTDGTNRFAGKIVVGGFPDEMEFQRQFDKNKQTLTRINATTYSHKLYSDDGQTVIQEWTLTKVGDDETRNPV